MLHETKTCKIQQKSLSLHLSPGHDFHSLGLELCGLVIYKQHTVPSQSLHVY